MFKTNIISLTNINKNQRICNIIFCISAQQLKNNLSKRGRKKEYNHPVILEVIRYLWIRTNLPCSKRLKEIIYQIIISDKTKRTYIDGNEPTGF